MISEQNNISNIGTGMHIDPHYTDAFNAQIQGEKWWVSMPKDLYEFWTDLTCLESCSDKPINAHHTIGVWYLDILPQIR